MERHAHNQLIVAARLFVAVFLLGTVFMVLLPSNTYLHDQLLQRKIVEHEDASVDGIDLNGPDKERGGIKSRQEQEQEPQEPQEQEPTRKPNVNVVLLYAEDLGFGDLSCYGHPYAQTPNIDKLAKEGMMMMNSHSTGKTCAPSRAGLMTGRFPASMQNYGGDLGFEDLATVTKLFRDAGYSAIGHVGKWHIGENLERKKDIYGMTEVDKTTGCESAYWYKDECVFDRAIRFIKENKDQPFYLHVWGHVAHSPIKVRKHLLDRFNDTKVRKEDFGFRYWKKLDQSRKLNNNLNRNMAHYLGAIYSMDYHVGRLLDVLDDLNLKDETIVVFTSDHGAARIQDDSSTEQNMLGYCGGLRDYKHSYYEGGLRVPFIVRWPRQIPAGTIDNSLQSGLDWLPTISTLAKVSYNKSDIHGESFADVWKGGEARNRRKPLFWNKEGRGDYAMLSKDGRWKLHFTEDEKWELYDLYNNMEESNKKNLIHCKKGLAKKMKEELRAWTRTLPTKYCRLEGCDKARFFKLDGGKNETDVPESVMPWMSTRSDINLYDTLPYPEKDYECL